MVRLTVLYGHPEDPTEFDRYYREIHVPLAKRMRGIKGWTIGKCEAAEPGQESPYYMIVGLYADSRAEMEDILGSPEGQATIADDFGIFLGRTWRLHPQVCRFISGAVYDNRLESMPFTAERVIHQLNHRLWR